ncbi:hypothetical protein LPJCHP_LPJCHP_02675, partial [Dysosmobacter welbionis]
NSIKYCKHRYGKPIPVLILRLTYRDYLHPPMSQTSPEVSTSSTFNVPYLCFSSYAQAAPIAAFAAVLDPLSFPVHIRQ